VSERLTTRDYFLTWLWYFLSTTIAGAAFGGLIGAAIGAASGTLGVARENVIYSIGIITFVAGAVVSFLLFRYFVSRLLSRAVEKSANAAVAA
jgi:membrane protein implicated in regulation of membrane protease activity